MKPRIAWILAILAGLALRLVLALQPIEFLVEKVIPDDAFYYFVISRHAASGLGLTFDGVQATNGFHPLWAFILVPVYAIIHSPDQAVHAILALGTVIDTAAGLVFARLAERIRPGAGLLALALYLFNPRLIFGSVNGLESALALLFMAAGLWQMYRTSMRPTLQEFLFLGICLGLAFLARSDLAVVFLPAAAACAWLAWKNRQPGDTVEKHLLRWLAGGAAGLAVILPWLAWCQIRVGHVLQSSAAAVPGLITDVVSAGGAWESLQAPVLNYSLRSLLMIPGAAWLAMLAATCILVLNRRRQAVAGEPADSRAGALAWSALLGGFLVVCVHTFVRWYPREWYFLPLAAAAAVCGALLLREAGRFLRPAARSVLAFSLALVVVLSGLKTLATAEFPGQLDLLSAARWVNSSLPEDTVIGGFNSGLMAYYSGRQVINLDGVVDWQAIQARQQGRLLKYLRERGGRYLVDARATIEDSYSPWFGMPLSDLSLAASFEKEANVFGPVQVLELPVSAN